MKLGDVFPNFEADTTIGRMKFHDYLGSSWGILFSHPADFTPVCTTELGRAAKVAGEFAKRNVKMAALSCDGVDSHKAWIADIKAYSGFEGEWPYPIVADEDRSLATGLGEKLFCLVFMVPARIFLLFQLLTGVI